MVSGGGVVIDTWLSAGIHVHGRVIKARYAMDELVLGRICNGVGLDDAKSAVDGQGDLGVHSVADPAQLDAVVTPDSGHVT